MHNGPIRILRVIARLNVGGPALNASLLTARLSSEQFQSWLICGHPEGNEKEDTELIRRLGISPIYIDDLSRSLGITSDFQAFRRLQASVRALNPDIIHTHTAKAGTLGRAVGLLQRLGSKRRPRLVHTFHGHVFSGYFRNSVAQAFVGIERILARFTDVIIAVSPEVRRELVEVYRIAKPEKVRVVPLGFEFDWVSEIDRYRGRLRKSLGATDTTVIFGMVGRLTKVKNQALALHGLSRAIRTDPTLDLRLVIFGDGEDRSGLESLARELGLVDRISFQGWELDRARIFSDLDATCLTSVNEGTPVCLIESLAAGVPVISTRVGGVGDVVREGGDGILVETENPDALASGLVQIARRSKNRVKPERAGEVRQFYSVSRLTNDVEDIYRDVVHNRMSA